MPLIVAATSIGGWQRFGAPERIVQARTIGEVGAVIAAADDYAKGGGYVAGFVSYEAAPAFDNAQVVRESTKQQSVVPLAWFALCSAPPCHCRLLPSKDAADAKHIIGKWRRETGKADYLKTINDIHRRIRAGEVYQINHTWRMHSGFAGAPLSWFADIARAQPSQWSFFAETEDWAVCSASPECFFSSGGGGIVAKPMKGTRPNKPGAAKQLATSAKDRAENLMIVDMIRNDLAKLSDSRNIIAAPLLQVEEYPTVLQMTSTISCQSNARMGDIFAALFPCASVTGAPKIAAMEAIRELELSPRGVYCGACGWADKLQARFNVAIRTAVIDKSQGIISYGAGSGIVADSTGGGEWQECANKAAILSAPPPPHLIETMRAENGEVALLPLHLQRLTAAARALGFAINRAAVQRTITTAAAKINKSAKLRLTLHTEGKTTLQTTQLPKQQTPKLCILKSPPIMFCQYKTNRRRL